MTAAQAGHQVARFAGILAAMGSESRLLVIRLLLSAHPDGLVVGEIQEETGIAPSTLSHHLDSLRGQGVVTVERQGTFLRYRANGSVLSELLAFFYAECCTRNAVVDASDVVCASAGPPTSRHRGQRR